LLYVIAEDKKGVSPLNELFNFKELKYKERDEIADAITSWNKKIPFEMEKHFDTRVRYIFKERYDYRRNLLDWDY